MQRFDALMPALLLDVAKPTPDDLGSVFSKKFEFLVLEIGFGGGEHLTHQAKSYPENGYIGVEPFVNSMAKALRTIENNSLENIRLYDDDAVELLDWMPDGSVDRVDLLYPDPWPKMRHWKRRFVNQRNLDRIARVLKNGGKFHFASDIASYINWTLQHCERHPDFEWQAETAADWDSSYNNWIQTRYEAKAVREGRKPCYLRFERK